MRLGKNVQETKKLNIEIINNLKQTLSKPTIVEAQRTLKILEKLIEKIGIFLNLDSDFLIKFNEINNPQKLKLNKTLIQDLSPLTLELIVKQAKMQIQFKSYALLQQQMKQGEIIEDQKIQEYNRIKKDMQYNFKTLIRSLQKNPKDIDVLKSLKSTTTVNQGINVYEALSNYKIIMQKTLATAAEEQESHTRLIEELQMKITSLEKTKINCQNDLLKLRQQRAKHAEQKKQQIDKLKSQIRQVKNNKEKQIQNISKQSKLVFENILKQHKIKQDKLKSQINTEKIKLTKLRDQNNKRQTKSKNDKITNQTQFIDMLTSYDKDMQKLSQVKTNSQKDLKRLSDELNNLKRHFLQIEEERKREEQILQADRIRKEHWELIQRRKGEAITRIKQAYRLWKLKNKKKKKKRR